MRMPGLMALVLLLAAGAGAQVMRWPQDAPDDWLLAFVDVGNDRPDSWLPRDD